MHTFISLRRLSVVSAVVAAMMVVAFPETVCGYTPDSPEVKQAVAKGVSFLGTTQGIDDRMGGKALVALALIKCGAEQNHPRVVEALAAVKSVTEPRKSPAALGVSNIYQMAMACLFLLEIDPVAHRQDIEYILKYFQSVQKPMGAWGYLGQHEHAKTGDTSMTQYGVLCAWEAAQAGFDVPIGMVDRCAIWLLKTQDPTGSYGYQGIVSSDFNPVRQKDPTLSLTAAGLGSLYACADLLGVGKSPPRDELPPALVKVGGTGRYQAGTRVNSNLVREAQERGDRWIENSYSIKTETWNLYYLYGLERYHSFRELAEGKSVREASWYNDGVKFLISSQSAGGYWETYHEVEGRPASTAFGMLFLVRSMKKSIEKSRAFGDGTLIGGRGLPSDTDSVFIREGQVTPMPQVQAVEKLLMTVGDASDPDEFLAIESLAAMSEQDAMPLINKHAEKLRQLAGEKSPDARLAAVRVLAKARNMDDVPIMIYALTDPDPVVVRAARDGLRRISRKFSGFELPDRFTDSERRVAVSRWKQWYLTVRPDAEFQD